MQHLNNNNKFGSLDSKYVSLLYSHKTTIYISFVFL